jgi:Protein kinase domain
MLRRKIGQFYLVEHLGTGGMSEVYLALNPRTREKRAVKVLSRRATASSASYARFLREVEIIRALHHPRIVKILDSGSLDDCYYYMMEYMPGGSLARHLRRGKLPLKEALALFGAICDGMAFAHDKGVIHRDLKPANILLDAEGTPAVSDFGIAKLLDGERAALTRSNEVMGTIAYLAPEQRWSAKKVDRRADVYSLGALFYEMIMSFPPLGNFPSPRESRPDFPPGVEAMMMKCLSVDPEKRYTHAGALQVDVERMQNDSTSKKPQPLKDAPEVVGEEWSAKSDRIEQWFHVLRTGTTRERLNMVREMVETMEPREAKAILKLYSGEEDRVRWGLIRVFGDLRITAATPMILGELKNPYHRECAIESLGKIGCQDAFKPIREYIERNPEGALIALTPLALTGGEKAIKHLRRYLSDPMAIRRQGAVRAIASILSIDCLQILREHLAKERDDKVRATVIQCMRSLELNLSGVTRDHDTETVVRLQS